jgi:hypothetical protein
VTDETLAAMAERMNRLDEVGVVWDRCVLLERTGAAFGWIARDDGRSDFVVVTFSWGETHGLDDALVPWIVAGYSTSSALYSARIGELLYGHADDHTDCSRVDDVFGALLNRKVEAAA